MKKYFYAVMALSLVVVSCKDDDTPEVVHEHEVFTKVIIDVTNQSDNSKAKYTFEVEHDDHDDHGTDDAGHDDHTEIELEADSTYKFEIQFINDSDPNDVEDITLEVIEESDDHQVFYELTDSSISIEAASDDTFDSNSKPVMLKTIWTTTTETAADVTAYLIHEPTSKTATTRNGFGGETDVEVEFEAHVEAE